MQLGSGTRVGPYEIVGAIGAGGMGEVFRARDERIGREVAIKVFSEDLSADAEQLRRFEQVRGETPDSRADVFSLGIVLWEMFVGSRPFEGTTQLDVLTAILNDDPQLPEGADVPESVLSVLLRCLEKNPGRRYQSAEDLAFHLDTLSTVSE